MCWACLVCFIQTCIHTLDLTVFLCSPEYDYDIWERIIKLLGMTNVNNHFVNYQAFIWLKFLGSFSLLSIKENM